MLTAEWNIDIAREVWTQEGREEGLEEGMEKGLEEGLEKGREEGLEKGMEKAKLEIARNLRDILDIQTIAQRLGLTAAEIAEMDNAEPNG